MNKNVLISIIIVSYNALEYLQKCIGSILNYSKGYNYELILIDNNSTPETLTYLENLYSNKYISHLIKNNENKLLTRAQNQGMNISSGDYLLFLNPDTEVFNDNWITDLIQPHLTTKENIAITGPVYNFIPYAPVYGNIDMCCFCISKKLVKELGNLDERYPWNGAGFMYTCEAWKKGYKYKHVKTNSIIHYGKKSRAKNSIPNVHYNIRKEMKERQIQARFNLIMLAKYKIFKYLLNKP